MIHDGYWQDDLVALANKITYWKNRANKLISQGCSYSNSDLEKARHQLTRSIFYSACIVRKMIEEENEAIRDIAHCFDMFPSDKPNNSKEFFKLYRQQLSVHQLPLKEDSINCFDDYCVEDYDFSTAKEVTHTVKSISNWIIHSYIWFLGSTNAKDRHIYGFFISSDFDKTKYACYIPIDVWCQTLKYSAENANL